MRKFLLLILCILGWTSPVWGQEDATPLINHKTHDDSLLNGLKANYLYDNPQKIIDEGTKILKTSPQRSTRFKAAILMATAYSSERNYKNALEKALKARAIAEKQKSISLRVQAYNKLGEIYFLLKVYDKSIQFLDKAERLCSAHKPLKSDLMRYQLASNYILRGFIYKDKLNCKIAISFFSKGIAEYKKIPGYKNNWNISTAAYNKGNCYVLLDKYEKAINSYTYARKVAVFNQANSLQAFAQKGLANVYTLRGNYAKAIALLKNARFISKHVNDLVLDREIYQGLAENYLALDSLKKYQNFNTLYRSYRLKVKKSERRSLSNSIKTIHQQRHHYIRTFKNKFYTLLRYLIAGALLCIILTFVAVKQENKGRRLIKKRIAKLQKKKT